LLSALRISYHLDEQRVPFFQNTKRNDHGLGDCGLLFLIERVSRVGVTDLTAESQARRFGNLG
jgi:hypothetical protein